MILLQKLKDILSFNKNLTRVGLALLCCYFLKYIFPAVSFLLIFLAFSGFCCIIYNCLLYFEKTPLKNIARSLRITALILIAVFLISMVFIQINIFTGMKDTETECDYLLVLGASVRNNKPSKAAIYRMDRALEYLERYPDTKVIVCGGLGSDTRDSEALVMKRYLLSKSVPEHQIILEDRSTDTTENILFAKEIIEQSGNSINSYKIGIATSGYHIYRSMIIAQKAGIENAYSLVADNPGFITYNLSCHLREYFSVILEYFNL